MKKFFKCKRDAFHLNGEIAFRNGKEYQFEKTFGNIVFLLDSEGNSKPMTKEYFKENFNQKPIKK